MNPARGRPTSLPFVVWASLLTLNAGLGSAQEDPAPVAELTANLVEFRGPTLGAAPFAGLLWGDYGDAGLRAVASPPTEGFRLHAESLRVEIDEETRDLNAANVQITEERLDSHPSDHANASAASTAPRPGHMLAILPDGQGAWPTIEFHAEQGAAGPSPPSALAVPRFARSNDRPELSLVRDGALDVDLADTTAGLTVRGDFLITLWEWDFSVASATRDETQTVRTGRDAPTVVANPAGGSNLAEKDVRLTQAYLYVHNGTLELPAYARPVGHFLLAAASLDVEGFVAMVGAEGRVWQEGTAQPLDASRLEMEGRIQLDLATKSGRVSTTVAGDVSQAQADGAPLALGAGHAPVNASSFDRWLTGLLVAGLVAPTLGAGGTWARRRTARTRLRRAEEAMTKGDHAAVVQRVAKLHASAHRPEAIVLQVDALLRLGRVSEARTVMESTTPWKGPMAAMHEYLLAAVAAHAGRPEAAAVHLHACLSQAPELVPSVRADPVFSAARQRPPVHDLLTRRSPSGGPS